VVAARQIRRPLHYLYSGDELKEFTETAGAARALVKKLYLYTNNHFSAKSVANATMIKQQLGEPIDGEYPPEFLAPLSGAGRASSQKRCRHCFTDIFRIKSPRSSRDGTSSPEMIWPMTV